ncbi:MAG: hypothetical protein JWP97_6710 [Labilithrix sp.]|nr:hypothetical protein [Labilithrix sp.]
MNASPSRPSRPAVRARSRIAAFVVLTVLTGVSLLAGAQTKKPATAPAKKPATRPAARPEPEADAGPAARDDLKAGKQDGGAVEAKTLDGGTRVFRFGEVEVEGRLKSPQIVYFLRRVRAEFAAGDLGHRSFVRELEETKNEPGF